MSEDQEPGSEKGRSLESGKGSEVRNSHRGPRFGMIKLFGGFQDSRVRQSREYEAMKEKQAEGLQLGSEARDHGNRARAEIRSAGTAREEGGEVRSYKYRLK